MKLLKSLINLGKSIKTSYFNGRAKRLGLARILTTQDLKDRNEQILRTYENMQKGMNFDDSLLHFNAKNFGERAVEYPFIFNWILEKNEDESLLDVGSVLNNPIISDHIQEKTNAIWFCNPAFEPVIYKSIETYYHLSSLENAFKKTDLKFENITCISTLEHIGYDNSHYGVKEKAEFDEPNDDVFLESVDHLTKLLDKNGRLLISVPYGKREVLKHARTLKGSSQVFDSTTATKLKEALGDNFSYKFSFYRATLDGWIASKYDECDSIRYAGETFAAGAVWFIEINN